MQRAGSTTKSLLTQILQSPNENNCNNMIIFLSSPSGYEDFLYTLKENHLLSIIYLKNYVQKWIDSNLLNIMYSESTLNLIISECIKGTFTENSMVHFADFFEVLSNNYCIPACILSTLVENKIFILIDAVFKKYTVHPRSDRLFTEINSSINLFFPIFTDLYFQPQIITAVEQEYQKVLYQAQNTAQNIGTHLIRTNLNEASDKDQEFLLSIFYSLIYQDIHPLFEDNALYFLKIFFVLFDQHQQMINKIFDLFITKYPEVTDFNLIILTLCRIDRLDGLIVNTITKAISQSNIFANVVIQFLTRTLTVVIDEDWLTETQNITRGNDSRRGFTHKLIRFLNCNVYCFSGETLFFVATILKYKDQNIISEAYKIINSKTNDLTLVFSVFRYLMTVQEYGNFDISYLNTEMKHMLIKYICNLIKSKEAIHKNLIKKRILDISINHSKALETILEADPLQNLDIKSIYEKGLKILQDDLDEFSAELIYRLVKNRRDLITDSLYGFLNYQFKQISRISSISLSFLIEIYIECAIHLKKYDLSIVETILKEGAVDVYNHCFFYLSVLINESAVKGDIVLYILQQNALWSTRDIHPGLCCIVLAAYKKGIIQKSQLESITELVDGFNRTFLLSKCGIQKFRDNDTPEESYLINGILDANWFLENFLNKKYARMVIKKIINDEANLPFVFKVFEKNIINVEHEVYLHSITKYFDI